MFLCVCAHSNWQIVSCAGFVAAKLFCSLKGLADNSAAVIHTVVRLPPVPWRTRSSTIAQDRPHHTGSFSIVPYRPILKNKMSFTEPIQDVICPVSSCTSNSMFSHAGTDMRNKSFMRHGLYPGQQVSCHSSVNASLPWLQRERPAAFTYSSILLLHPSWKVLVLLFIMPTQQRIKCCKMLTKWTWWTLICLPIL